MPALASPCLFTPEQLAPLILAVGRAGQSMTDADRAVWESHLQLVYGEMSGQRSVDFSSLQLDLDRYATVAALESTYYLITVLLSTSAFRDDPAFYLRDQSRATPAQRKTLLRNVTTGNVYEDFGVHGCRDPWPLQWLAECKLGDGFCELLRMLSECWDGSRLKLDGDDPFQAVHRELFPSNLAHITGQFYSPPWLATLLIDDVKWNPDERLIDPYCGSGVFLIQAARKAIRSGMPVGDVLKKLVGIDLDPFAAAGARANLALLVAQSRGAAGDAVSLNVLCADAIYPSMVKGRQELVDEGTSVEPAPESPDDLFRAASTHGLDLSAWCPHDKCETSSQRANRLDLSWQDTQQQLVCHLRKADVVATNPPWVGWEYLSRPYRDQIQPAWTTHDLYRSTGLEASFLKEDLSNLALLAAWDAYLRDRGRSVVVIRPSTMHSEVASSGVRRLSLSQGGGDLRLEHIRTFDNIRLFKSASTGAATWQITKGLATEFPVPVSEFRKRRSRWNPSPSDSLPTVTENVDVIEKVAEVTAPNDAQSRWMIVQPDQLDALRQLRGANRYTPRMGVFTGGANAVYYLHPKEGSETQFTNVTARAKRKVEQVTVELERPLVHWVARGRDLSMWRYQPETMLLLPHTPATQMHPIPESELRSEFPKTHRYLKSMEPTLRERNGFAGWEKKIHQQHFFALQRIGSYTFAPYKVCWRYIAKEFIVCVLGSDPDGKVIIPNDKVMFIPMEDPDEAYFVAGYLSSEMVRRYVDCIADKLQISTRVIQSLAIPDYEADNPRHQQIRDACREGHERLATNPNANVNELYELLSLEQ